MTSISKLLIANRGEIASRIMRTAHQMDIATVAVYSDPDCDAPFVSDADEAVRLPGDSPTDTYLRLDLIVGAAIETQCVAVHPGYGFLSERSDFAIACEAAGLIFVGPSSSVIETMGSKVTAKERMARAGVPVLPGFAVQDGVESDEDLQARAAHEIGFPLLVKAEFGGGGRGMRVITNPAELPDIIRSARREAKSAFGNDSVFLERYVETPRHVEVQIFGDTHGTVVSLFERECSIQRRYQKVIEEAPSPVVDFSLREELGEAAIAAGKAIGYVGAGTVEFVLASDRRFYFLEVNTRLQVEHPVTELITGIDLVRLQLEVAEGKSLPAALSTVSISGHAIEARLYAEDVSAGFLPSAGPIHRFSVPELPGVRVDNGVATGSSVSVHYDPMLAKVVAHGRDRDQARRRLARALDQSQIHGIPTNRELLVGILRDPEFAAGHFDTGFLQRRNIQALCNSRTAQGALQVHALTAALASQAERRLAARVLTSLPSGWRNVFSSDQTLTYAHEDIEVSVGYHFDHGELVASIDGQCVESVVVYSVTPDQVDIRFNGIRRIVSVNRVESTSFVDSSMGSSVLTELPRFPTHGDLTAPGSLIAPMPGTVVRISHERGDAVKAGSSIVVLEAMKMEHAVVASADGILTELLVAEGQTVDAGTVLAVVRQSDDEQSA
jgi:acetyl/propionyl-CoA carboxylase alpha subunit